eukprot:4318354-Karenia_brevis.AAC.1
MPGCKKAPLQVSKKDRPKWYSAQLNSLPVWKVGFYGGIKSDQKGTPEYALQKLPAGDRDRETVSTPMVYSHIRVLTPIFLCRLQQEQEVDLCGCTQVYR